MHEAKAVSFAILQEIALVWPDEIAKSATHAFRETKGGDGDFYQLFIFAHYLVERAREAYLWTWAVARVGGIDDRWDAATGALAWRELGGTPGEDELQVVAGRRRTLENERVSRVLTESGHRGASKTVYLFCASSLLPSPLAR